MGRAERNTSVSLPDMGKLNEKARVGPARVPYNKWASLPAYDSGPDWITTQQDVGEDSKGKKVGDMVPYFHRTERINTGTKISLLGRRRQLKRTQTGKANHNRPYYKDQELSLVITQDSGWRKASAPIPWREQTNGDRWWTVVRRGAPLLLAGCVVMGGTGNRMPDEDQVTEAQERVIAVTKHMSGKEQYEAYYIDGGNGDHSVASFDDTSGWNIVNMGISRYVAERNYANVAIGDDCLEDTGYNTRGRGAAAYKETPGGKVTIVSQGGARLLFELEGGVLQPGNFGTVATLQSYECETEGVPAGLTGGGIYESTFVVPFS